MSKPFDIPRPNRLSSPVEIYFDREKEFHLIMEFLKKDLENPLSGKVCMIHGVPGMGKTELCQVVANQLLEEYSDAQVYIKLDEMDTGDTLLYKIFEIIIHLFDPFTHLTDDLEILHEQYLSALNGSEVLIILDDLQSNEKLSLLFPPPSCALLITSQSALEIPEALLVHLAGLSRENSEKLLTSICPRIGKNAPDLSSICRNTPLCLRLIASALSEKPDLKVEDCMDELQERSRRAEAGDQNGTAVAEQFVSYIFEQLQPAEKLFLLRLGIIPDGFKMELAVEMAHLLSDGKDEHNNIKPYLDTFVRLNFLAYDDARKYYRMQPWIQIFAEKSLENSPAVWLGFAKIYADGVEEFISQPSKSADDFLLSLILFDEHKSNIKKIIQYLRNHSPESLDTIKLDLFKLINFYGKCRFLPIAEMIPILETEAGIALRLNNADNPSASLLTQSDLEQFTIEKTKIILTGFMGTGKTTVGKMLANLLNYTFIDTDELIESKFGRSIADIFSEFGEEAFREMERKIVKEVGDQEGVVISTGGRLMLDPENVNVLSRNGRVFCLVATPDEIITRVSKDASHVRPLLSVPNPKQRIVELLQERNDKYRRFPQIVTDEKEPTDIASSLVEFINTSPKSIFVGNPQKSYEYVVGAGLLPFIRQITGVEGEIVIITDEVVNALYGPSCASMGQIIKIPSGRQEKSFATVQLVYDQLIDMGFDRSGTIISLGGSVVGDIAGYVAATYMRGVEFVQCPTSLLSMVDTSVGGKTSIDLPQGKNIIGVYKQPIKVIADVATLQTLPQVDFASGMAEVIKHGLVAESDLLEQIEHGHWEKSWDRSPSNIGELQRLVAQAIQVKINIVQSDPFEEGRRSILNLGHTFAYAIEQESNNAFRHGEAVSIGLVAAANLSARLGYCDVFLQNRIETILESIKLPTRIPSQLKPEALLLAMQRDKKKRAGQLRFILIRGVGNAFVSDEVSTEAILDTISDLSG